MDCIKEKKFLWWKWKIVKHNYKPNCISKFMVSSETYHVSYKCTDRGSFYIKKFVTQNELFLMGVDLNKLSLLEVNKYETVKFKE